MGELLSLWGIPVASEACRTSRGSNNTTFTIRHDDRCWVLRVSQNLSVPQVAAEHRLLERLRRAGLPFAVPEPVAALDGRTVVETGEGPATVCRWLPGVPADLAGPGMLERFGRACGQLSGALKDVPPQDAPHDWRGSDPLLVHPDVPGFPALCQELRQAGADTRPLETAARRVMEWWDTSRECLPVQVVHGDPAASKRRAAPLIAGFGSSARLTESEIRALPAMILWRSVGTVLWRAGRWRRGLDQAALIAKRIEDLVHTTDWIDHHGHALIALGLTRASR